MGDLQSQLSDKYGGQLRIRVCGIWIEGDEILLVHHKGLGPNNSLWIPPGGGIEFGESIPKALKREFKEETGVDIEVEEFLFVCEFFKSPYHAIELFFKVKGDRSQLVIGTDPELEKDNQIITQVSFRTINQIQQEATDNLHQSLHNINNLTDLFIQKGYFKIG